MVAASGSTETYTVNIFGNANMDGSIDEMDIDQMQKIMQLIMVT